MTQEQADLLDGCLGLLMKDEVQMDADDSWQHKPIEELKALTNDQLKTICKTYGQPHSNKKKDQLSDTIRLGPKEH